MPGDWGNIKFTDSSTDAVFDENNNYLSGSIIQYSNIKYGGGSVDAAVIVDGAHPYIENNIIADCNAQGIYASNLGGAGAQLFINKNIITNNDNTYTNEYLFDVFTKYELYKNETKFVF